MLFNKLKKGDTIGIIAPSRPFFTYKDDFDQGVKYLKDFGYKIKFGQNINERFYYSAGNAEQRASDLNKMFADSEINAIFCAVGGISSNQLLPLMDFELIEKNPKLFIGFSDVTTLLLSIYQKTGLNTIHGPDICELGIQTKKTAQHFEQYLRQGNFSVPQEMEIIKPGVTSGTLVGGNLLSSNALLGTEFSPNYENAIWFWEAVNESPAKLHFLLQQFKLSGNMEKIKAMIIGHLEDCVDKKYPEDNRSIQDILFEVTKNYNFPIIKVNYFGHGIQNFHPFPIGFQAKIDTKKKIFLIFSS